MIDLSKLSEKDLQKLTNNRKKRKRMKTNKKAFLLLTIWAMIIQTYVMVMIVRLKDTMSLSIITGVVFGEIIAFYLGYLKYSEKIDIKSMDMNFNPNYDEENNIY